MIRITVSDRARVYVDERFESLPRAAYELRWLRLALRRSGYLPPNGADADHCNLANYARAWQWRRPLPWFETLDRWNIPADAAITIDLEREGWFEAARPSGRWLKEEKRRVEDNR